MENVFVAVARRRSCALFALVFIFTCVSSDCNGDEIENFLSAHEYKPKAMAGEYYSEFQVRMEEGSTGHFWVANGDIPEEEKDTSLPVLSQEVLKNLLNGATVFDEIQRLEREMDASPDFSSDLYAQSQVLRTVVQSANMKGGPKQEWNIYWWWILVCGIVIAACCVVRDRSVRTSRRAAVIRSLHRNSKERNSSRRKVTSISRGGGGKHDDKSRGKHKKAQPLAQHSVLNRRRALDDDEQSLSDAAQRLGFELSTAMQGLVDGTTGLIRSITRKRANNQARKEEVGGGGGGGKHSRPQSKPSGKSSDTASSRRGARRQGQGSKKMKARVVNNDSKNAGFSTASTVDTSSSPPSIPHSSSTNSTHQPFASPSTSSVVMVQPSPLQPLHDPSCSSSDDGVNVSSQSPSELRQRGRPEVHQSRAPQAPKPVFGPAGEEEEPSTTSAHDSESSGSSQITTRCELSSVRAPRPASAAVTSRRGSAARPRDRSAPTTVSVNENPVECPDPVLSGGVGGGGGGGGGDSPVSPVRVPRDDSSEVDGGVAAASVAAPVTPTSVSSTSASPAGPSRVGVVASSPSSRSTSSSSITPSPSPTPSPNPSIPVVSPVIPSMGAVVNSRTAAAAAASAVPSPAPLPVPIPVPVAEQELVPEPVPVGEAEHEPVAAAAAAAAAAAPVRAPASAAAPAPTAATMGVGGRPWGGVREGGGGHGFGMRTVLDGGVESGPSILSRMLDGDAPAPSLTLSDSTLLGPWGGGWLGWAGVGVGFGDGNNAAAAAAAAHDGATSAPAAAAAASAAGGGGLGERVRARGGMGLRIEVEDSAGDPMGGGGGGIGSGGMGARGGGGLLTPSATSLPNTPPSALLSPQMTSPSHLHQMQFNLQQGQGQGQGQSLGLAQALALQQQQQEQLVMRGRCPSDLLRSGGGLGGLQGGMDMGDYGRRAQAQAQAQSHSHPLNRTSSHSSNTNTNSSSSSSSSRRSSVDVDEGADDDTAVRSVEYLYSSSPPTSPPDGGGGGVDGGRADLSHGRGETLDGGGYGGRGVRAGQGYGLGLGQLPSHPAGSMSQAQALDQARQQQQQQAQGRRRTKSQAQVLAPRAPVPARGPSQAQAQSRYRDPSQQLQGDVGRQRGGHFRGPPGLVPSALAPRGSIHGHSLPQQQQQQHVSNRPPVASTRASSYAGGRGSAEHQQLWRPQQQTLQPQSMSHPPFSPLG